MTTNLGILLATTARERPDHPALLADRRITYTELDRAARGIATGLRERGLGPGDHVALLIPNVPEFTMAYFGALYAGCAVVPLNVLLTESEIAYHLQDSDARLLIAHGSFADGAERGAREAGVPLLRCDAGSDGLDALCTRDPIDGPVQRSETDTAVILYTSGTTGKPKGAELTHSNLLLNAALVASRVMGHEPDDVVLAVLPLFHSFGQTCIQNASIAVGATIALVARFEPEPVLALMARERVSFFAGVPTMYFALLHCPAARQHDLSALRVCCSGGAALPVEVLREFEKRFGVLILEGYGLSETSPVACFNLRTRPRKPGYIGYPVWGVDMCILDEQDRPVADGSPGEICIRGHNIMKGYWKRPEATKDAIRDGWFHSGDIGIRESDGSFRIVDRKKDMIIRGGFNVYPREIEEVLFGHPAIAEAAVIGVPDERYGEEIKAVIVLRAGTALTAEQLIAYMRERVAAFKYPRLVEFRDALPKGPTGKILKRILQSES
jgi:long-chain acyl-CoA synthetase